MLKFFNTPDDYLSIGETVHFYEEKGSSGWGKIPIRQTGKNENLGNLEPCKSEPGPKLHGLKKYREVF